MTMGRIFLVEDDVLVRLDTSQQLTVMGYDVVGQAGSGTEALLLITETRPDLVLMDITISGGIDGIETARRIPQDLQVAVVFLAACSDDITRNRAGQELFWGYLVKPVAPQKLRETMDGALQRRATLQALQTGRDQLAVALDTAQMASWDWDPVSRSISFGSQAACVLGAAAGPSTQTEAAFLSRVVAEDRALGRAIFDALAAGAESCEGEFRYQHPLAGERWLTLRGKSASVVPGPRGRIVGIIQDVTERRLVEQQLRQAEEQLVHLAHHDPMTGLPNRLLAMDRLDRALERSRRRKEMVAIAFVDLDHFKQVNDNLGHTVGDDLLRIVAERIKSCVRSEDTVARLGGDEFLVIMERIGATRDAATIAKKIQSALAEPISNGDVELSASCTIGISIFPTDALSRDGLIRAADTAMHISKENGRGTASFYNQKMALESRLFMLETRDLRRGLEADELRLFYMPQISLLDGSVVGVEGLIRWQHSTRGLLGADHVIPLSERSGLIVDIGDWVIRTACNQLALWRDAGLPNLRMAINVSAKQMYSGGLLATVCNALDESAIAPECLEIEITESTLQNEEGCLATLSALSDLGVTLAIDDFGTGYSCLSSLKSLPLHRVKIDRAFVNDITHDESDRAITEAILVMSHKLKMRVIAEGVETLAQERLLRAQGCDEAQGFLYGKPMPADAIAQYIRETNMVGRALPEPALVDGFAG